ncbi:MAG: SDR family NAD(P)-dependent oxidoreductase [Burkholderiales bacterium]|nr:MAG: SDR family NAD(P)-dependent oxidoreductase [Burkholderiales bacterium]
MLAPLNPPIRDWHDKRVWIIGASSGIGAALARRLQELGARVAVSARREQALSEVAADRPMLLLPLDVNDAPAVRSAYQTIREQWGGLDLMCWVAGIYRPMRAHEIDAEAAHRMADTNYAAVFDSLACVLPDMLAAGSGAIGLVASVAGYRGLPQALGYGPTKAALIHLAETMYLDLRPRGIGVHLICPGFVDTPATSVNEFRMPHLITADEAARQIVAGLQAGRFETHFPRRFTLQMKLLRLLPYRAFFATVRRTTRL